jgi:hypothetical protein
MEGAMLKGVCKKFAGLWRLGAWTLDVHGVRLRDLMYMEAWSGGPGHVLDSLSRQPVNREWIPTWRNTYAQDLEVVFEAS